MMLLSRVNYVLLLAVLFGGFLVTGCDDTVVIEGPKNDTLVNHPDTYVMSPEWKIIRLQREGYGGSAIYSVTSRIDTARTGVYIHLTRSTESLFGGLYYPNDASLEKWNYVDIITPAVDLAGPSYSKGTYYVVASGPFFAGGGYGSGLYKSQNGINWQKIYERGFYVTDYRDLCFVNDTSAYVADANGKLLYSTDEAKTFVTRNASINLSNIYFTDLQNGHASSGGSQLKTADGGVTWVETFKAMSGAKATFSYPDNAVGFAITADAKVYRTADSGTTWMQTTIHDDKLPNSTVTNATIGFQNEIAYLLFTLKGEYPIPRITYMYRSTDGGRNWTSDGRNIFLLPYYSLIKDGFIYVTGAQNFTSSSPHKGVDSLAYTIMLKRPL